MEIKSLKSESKPDSPSEVVAKAILLGKIEGKSFYRRNTKVPSNFKRVKKFNYYSFFNQLRLVFFTNVGVFYGPPFISCSGEPGWRTRQLKCHVLTEIDFEFRIDNVLCFDFEYAQIIRPNAKFPIEIYIGESIQFAFEFPFMTIPDGRHYCV